jgi:HlyD family secretion protein
MSRRLLIGLGILLLVAIGLVARGMSSGGGLAVEVGTVETRDEFRSYVTASGEIVAERYADIGSSAMGRVVEMPVREGQVVERGQLLARIDPVQARSELDAAQAAIRALEAEASASGDQIEAAQADIELALAREREATQSFERVAALGERNLVSRSELDTARAAAETATAQVAAAEAGLARARGSRDAAERRIAQSRAQAARVRDVLDKTAILAPIDGTITRLQVREGEMVVIGIQNQPGTVLMTVSDLSVINAEVRVAEADVLRLEVGQAADVSLEALPGRIFAGTVTEVGASALPQIGSGAAAREFRVVVRLDAPEPGLRPGLTGDAEILVGLRTGVTTAPLQAVVLRLDEEGVERRGVFVADAGSARFVAVETGIIGGLDIEVTGLEPGTEIVTGPYQVLRDLRDGDAIDPRG